MRVRAVLLAAALVTLVTAGTSPARADILIAVAGPMSVTPLTGQYATFGEELKRGAEMAVRDVNEKGGINGQPLRLLTADDACNPQLAVEVAEELARQRVVLVDGTIARAPLSRLAGLRGLDPTFVSRRAISLTRGPVSPSCLGRTGRRG